MKARTFLSLCIALLLGVSTAGAQAPDAGKPPPPPEPLEDESAPEEDEPGDAGEPDEAEPEEPTAPADEPPADEPPAEGRPDAGPPAEEAPPPGEAPPDPRSPEEDLRSPTAIEPEPAPEPSAPAPAETAEQAEPAAPRTAPDPEQQPAARRRATAPPPAPTAQRAGAGQADDKQKDEEEGRGSEVFWIEPFFGYSYISLTQFRQDNFLPETTSTEAHGFSGGVSLGFKVWWLALGARGLASRYPDWFVGSLMFDAALRIPLGPIEPYIRLGLGYAWVGNPNFDDLGTSEVDVFGFVAEAGAGIDFFVSDHVAIGFGVDATALNLTRQDVRNCDDPEVSCSFSNANLREDGDAVGFQLRAQGHLGFHF